MESVDLDTLADEQLRAAVSSSSGRAAHTVHGGSQRLMRQTVIALAAGRSLAEHENPGEATVLVLRGRVRLVAGADDAVAGGRGELLLVPPARHSLEALEDSVVLLSAVNRNV